MTSRTDRVFPPDLTIFGPASRPRDEKAEVERITKALFKGLETNPMTMKLTIRNDDTQNRVLNVVTIGREKKTGKTCDIQQQHIQPGQSAEFYVHAFQELRVEEHLPIDSV